MPKQRERDVEKAYPRKDFVARLRRLADALEAGKAFTLQLAGKRLHIPADAVLLEFQLRWTRRT